MRKRTEAAEHAMQPGRSCAGLHASCIWGAGGTRAAGSLVRLGRHQGQVLGRDDLVGVNVLQPNKAAVTVCWVGRSMQQVAEGGEAGQPALELLVNGAGQTWGVQGQQQRAVYTEQP